MAKLKESVIGVLVGQIGQVVGSTWKGISSSEGASRKRCQPKDRCTA